MRQVAFSGRLPAAILVWLVASPEFAAAQPMANMPGMASPHSIPGATFAPAGGAPQEDQAAMKKMMAGMDAPYTGNVDHDFVIHMIPHHQGAIDMCVAEDKYGSDPKLKALCRQIIVAQQEEIRFMQSWLAKNPPVKSSIQWK